MQYIIIFIIPSVEGNLVSQCYHSYIHIVLMQLRSHKHKNIITFMMSLANFQKGSETASYMDLKDSCDNHIVSFRSRARRLAKLGGTQNGRTNTMSDEEHRNRTNLLKPTPMDTGKCCITLLLVFDSYVKKKTTQKPKQV